MKANDPWQCPHCRNTKGCAFGRCCECGFNYLTGEFEIICVHVDDLPWSIRDRLVECHADRTRGLYRSVR